LLRFNLTILKTLLIAGVVGALAPSLFGASQAPKRLRSNLNDSETFVLKGNTRPVVANGLAQDQGPVSGSQVMPRMSIHFKLTAAQQADLDQLLAAQQNRRSPQFHKFLTPEDYANRFGLNSADIEKVTAWLENNGFSNVQAARSRTWIAFSGTAAQAQNAFHTAIHKYLVNGEAHFANASDPQMPKALEGIAQGVRGLHNFHMKPHIRLPQAHFTSSISGNTYLAPADWATIYDVNPLYNAGVDGTGVTIAVVGQSDVNLSDLSNFRTASGLPAKAPTVVIPPNDKDPGFQFSSGDESESDLDLEWSNAIAKNADILFITADSTIDNGVEDAIIYAIDNNLAPILSTSYGLCEPEETTADFDAQQTLFAQANAQGVTIVAAAGDDGAADCDSGTNETVATLGLAVDFPASSQYVTGIGGTTLQAEGAGMYFSSTNSSGGGSALSYIPEAVWNDGTLGTAAVSGFQNATGGGVSSLVPQPAWQSGLSTAISTGRNVPDLALTSSPNTDGLLYCTPYGSAGISTCVNGTFRNNDSQTTLNVTGGTSTGPPTFSGVLALLLQSNGPGSRVGNINANLYQLAATAATNIPFHDITNGSNNVPCEGGTPNCPSLTATVNGQYGYSAGVGYDQTTGLGSIDANNLVQDWSFDFKLSSTPSSLTIQSGNSSSATITVSPQSNFNGMVTFAGGANGCSVSSTLPNVTCSVTGATVSASGNTMVTITVPSSGSATPLLRWLRKLPPLRLGWLLLTFALMALIYALRKQRFRAVRFRFVPSLYAGGAAAALAITISAVSCGGGSSSGSVSAAPTPLALSCSLPSTAQVAVAYTGSCTASGGTAPYSYSISTGTLPSGLTLNASSGALTGSPSAFGTSSFTIKASDSGSPVQTATQAESNFVVTETGVVTVTAASGELTNTAQITVTVQ
jgi:subtilase family serine protease